jgi:iron complex outermembrane receptor protein
VASAAADELRSYEFDLPAQSLADSLRAVGSKASVNVVFEPAAVRDKRAPILRGAYSVEEALTRLLDGSSLTLRATEGGSFVIDRSPAEPPGPRTSGVEEIVVTGSRLARSTAEGAQEVRVYTKERISQSGQGTVADFLSTLPEVSMASPDSPTNSYANQTSVQLHGLPKGTTLVLINGRRVEINNYGFFDLNNIPLAALERIEVLPIGSSAIYGADSLAGAVNFILRKNLEGGEISGRYGRASGTDETDTSLAWGTSWTNGALSLIGSYQSRSALMGSERVVSARPEFPSLPEDACELGTVYSLNGGNLPGLTSARAALTRGIAGVPTVQDFASGAGEANRCGYSDSTALLSPSEREGLLATAHHRFGSDADTEIFTELLASRQNVPTPVGSQFSFYNDFGSVLPASNAFNPFGEAVGLSYRYTGSDYLYERSTDFIRPVLGLSGALPGGWHYELTGLFSRDRSTVTQTDVNYAALDEALASPDPATAFNPFSPGAPGSADLLASLVSRHRLRFNSETLKGEATVRGTLWTLPAGAIEAVFGASWERDSLLTDISDSNAASPLDSSDRRVHSFYTETRVPLVANTLDVTLAARYDSPDDFESKTTGQIGVEWRPSAPLLVRGGYASAYQAPQLPQLHGVTSTAPYTGFVDPFRGGETLFDLPVTQGPNPDLRPQTGRSRSIGVLYTSRSRPLQVSLTWWAIDIDDYIGTPGIQDLIDHPELFPGAVTRAEPSQQDLQNGFPGAITHVDELYTNFGKLHMNGVDMDFHFTMATALGELTPGLSVSRVGKYDSALTPDAPATSFVGQAGAFGTPGFAPRWKGTTSLAFKRGPLSANAFGRYVGHYNDYLGFAFPYPHDIGNFWLFDTSVRYDFGAGLMSRLGTRTGLHVEAGGVNIFNRLPKSSYYYYGYDSQQADIRGRFVYAQLGVTF